MSELTTLTQLAVILLVGIIASALAKRVKIPDILVLILTGIILGGLSYKGLSLFAFPSSFLVSIGIIALAIMVFESAAKIKLKRFDSLSWQALKLVMSFFILNVLFFSLALRYALGTSWSLAVLLATIMAGTSSSVMLSLSETKAKAVELLQVESLLNTPLTVVAPFIVLELMKTAPTIKLAVTLIEELEPLLTTVVSGIGAGMLVGIVLFKILRRTYSTIYSPLAVTSAALITYVLAENLGGSGVVAVTTLGLFFGNTCIKEKGNLIMFESLLAKTLYILVFVILGVTLRLPFTKEFLGMTLLLFMVHTALRFAAVFLTLRSDLSLKEKVLVGLINPKGMEFAIIVFFLTTLNLAGISVILDVAFAFMLYSLVLSSFVSCLIPSLVEVRGR